MLIEGFDLGNSPREYLTVRTPTLAMSTTNGTRAIVTAAERCERVLIASLLNLEAVTEAARAHGDDVAIFCAGVKGAFALDDSYVAGRIAGAPRRRPERRCRGGGQAGGVVRDGRGGVSRLAQRPQPDQPRPGARGGHSVLRARERARRRAAARRDARHRRPDHGLEAEAPLCRSRSFSSPATFASTTTRRSRRRSRRPRRVLPLFVLDDGIARHALRRRAGPARVPPRIARRPRRVAPSARRRARRAPR